MQSPKCECFSRSPQEMEERAYRLAAHATLNFELSCAHASICGEAFPHVAVTLIAMLVRCIAANQVQSLDCAEQVKVVLATLEEDARLSGEVIEAMIESNKIAAEGGTKQ